MGKKLITDLDPLDRQRISDYIGSLDRDPERMETGLVGEHFISDGFVKYFVVLGLDRTQTIERLYRCYDFSIDGMQFLAELSSIKSHCLPLKLIHLLEE